MNGISNQFNYLNKKDISFLENISTYNKFENGELIISPSFNNFNFFYIHTGIVRGYYITEEGEEKTIFVINNGGFFAAPESIYNLHPTKYYFKTIAETKAYKFDFRELEQLAGKHSNIQTFYLYGLKYIITTLVERLESFIGEKPEQRFRGLQNSMPLLINSANKKEIASILGISPNSLSRILTRINNKA